MNNQGNVDPDYFKENHETKSNFGITSGLIFIAIGIMGVALNLSSMYNSSKYYPKLTCLGMICLFMGIAFIMFPGPKEIDVSKSEKKITSLFCELEVFGKIIWILYFIASIACTIYICAIADEWTQIIGVFIALIAVSGFVFAIKYIIVLVSLFTKKSDTDFTSSMDEKQNSPKGFDYYNPSKQFAFLLLLAGLLIGSYSSYQFYQKAILGNFGGTQKTNEKLSYIEEHLDDYVPINILNYEGTFTAVIETVQDEEGEKNHVTARVRDIVKKAVSNGELGNSLNFYKGFSSIGIDDGEQVSTFNYVSLRKHPAIKAILENKEESQSIALNFFENSDKAKKFFNENYDGYVIYKEPYYYHECLMIWSIDGFAEFFNLQNNISEEDAVTGIQLLREIIGGELSESTYSVASLSGLLGQLYEAAGSDLSNTDLLLNYGAKSSYFVSSKIATQLYNENRDEEMNSKRNSESENEKTENENIEA